MVPCLLRDLCHVLASANRAVPPEQMAPCLIQPGTSVSGDGCRLRPALNFARSLRLREPPYFNLVPGARSLWRVSVVCGITRHPSCLCIRACKPARGIHRFQRRLYIPQLWDHSPSQGQEALHRISPLTPQFLLSEPWPILATLTGPRRRNAPYQSRSLIGSPESKNIFLRKLLFRSPLA